MAKKESDTPTEIKQAVIDAAKEVEAANKELEILIRTHTGVRVRLVPVPNVIVLDVQARIPDPPIPTEFDKDKGKTIENPFSPTYQRELQETEAKRNRAITDAMIYFGIQLVDPVPPLEEWYPDLERAAKFGIVDLDGYNLDDPKDVEYMYKRFILADGPIMSLVMRRMRTELTEEEVKRAFRPFQGDEVRATD